MATEAAVRAELEALGASLVIVSVYQFSAGVAAGNVISMTPAVGTLVAPGSTVTLTVSLGALAASRWTGNVPEVVQAAVESPNDSAMIVVFAFFDVPGDPLYACDAGANVEWDGHTWLGLGQFGSVEQIGESLEVYAQAVKATISGVDPTILAVIENEAESYHGSDVVFYLGVMNPRTCELLDTPEEIWGGFMDVATLEIDQNLGTVSVNCEHELRRQPKPSRWTDEQQRVRFSGDVFFDHLSEIPGYVGKWGARDVGYRGGGDGGRRQGRGHSREV